MHVARGPALYDDPSPDPLSRSVRRSPSRARSERMIEQVWGKVLGRPHRTEKTTVGWDGIGPPTPGFSVRPLTLTRRHHRTSSVSIREVPRLSHADRHPSCRMVSNGTVQVRSKAPPPSSDWLCLPARDLAACRSGQALLPSPFQLANPRSRCFSHGHVFIVSRSELENLVTRLAVD